jgi:hypothetical protein
MIGVLVVVKNEETPVALLPCNPRLLLLMVDEDEAI